MGTGNLEWLSLLHANPFSYKIPAVHKTQLIDNEVEELLLKRAVTRVVPCKDQFISTYILAPMETGEMGHVINLMPLNQYIQNIHFKMENIQMVEI